MKPRVLVGSDLDSVHHLVKTALQPEDFDVLSAYGHQALIELTHWAEPDLVIVAFLDEQASLGALARLRTNQPTEKTALAWIRTRGNARLPAPAHVEPLAHLTFPVMPTHKTLAACTRNLLGARHPWVPPQGSFDPTQTSDI